MIGQTLGHYRIEEKVGAGGMGEVYRARDLHLSRDVAIKVLPAGLLADAQARRRFRSEADALSKLNHPNIQTVHDFSTQEGVDYLVVEFVPGPTLAEMLTGGALEEKDVLVLGQQIVAALQEAHQCGVVHRDLKPANIKLTPGGQLKLLDFGLARLAPMGGDLAQTESLAQTHTVTGTLPYMAPEQLRGAPADTRSDIWSAGAVLYEMATGRRPFEGWLATAVAADIQHKAVTRPTQLNTTLTPRLEEIILKCLEKDPDHRYQSVKELAVDLRRLTAPSTVTAVEPVPAKTTRVPRWALSVAAVVLLLAAAWALDVGSLRSRLAGGAPGTFIDSIAVLPLENLTGDPAQDYFADGMTDALIGELSKISALKVIARTSVMQYKGVQKRASEIARELDVSGLIVGSVIRDQDQVRIAVQLVDGPTDRHLWGENYQRELRNILTLQTDVARAIAGQIRVQVTPQDQARWVAPRAVHPEAHMFYLQGRYHWNKRTPEGFQLAIRHFTEATRLDTDYAPAYAGLADCYNLMDVFDARILIPDARARGMAAAAKAVALDDASAEAHASLGFALLRHGWDWRGAEREYLRAIELNPGYAWAYHWYGQLLTSQRKFEEAYPWTQRALQLDPISPIIQNYRGLQLYFAGESDQFIEWSRKLLELHPDFTIAAVNVGRGYIQKGEYDRGIPLLEKEARAAEDHPLYIGLLGHAYAQAGRLADARRIVEQLKKFSSPGSGSYSMALVYAGLGDTQQALDWLERAYEERSGWMIFLYVDPVFDPLHGEPRFRDLLRRMNLATP